MRVLTAEVQTGTPNSVSYLFWFTVLFRITNKWNWHICDVTRSFCFMFLSQRLLFEKNSYWWEWTRNQK